jgi:glycosyltransferase involved in cell wall biosynthesis
VRIAYVVTRADAVGGASVHVRDLAQSMRSRGHEVLVLIGGTGHVTEQLATAGVPFRPLRFLQRAISPSQDVRAIFELTAALNEFRPDLVSTHTAKAGWIGRAASARLQVPAIFTPHGWAAGDRMAPAQAALFTLAEKAAARWAQAIICVCRYERQFALNRRIGRPEQLHVVPNGVREIPPRLISDPGAKPVAIVCVARFEPPKDHAALLEALAALRDLEWELRLVGDGPLEERVRSLAAELGIAGKVRFSGYLADPVEELARAQLFVLSSRSEAFPRSVLEAMRAGLPVVASDVGGVSEAVDNEVNGLLVPRGDVAALAKASAQLIMDNSRRIRMGEAGRRRYEAEFRLERMVDRTAAVYRAVLERNGKKRTSS